MRRVIGALFLKMSTDEAMPLSLFILDHNKEVAMRAPEVELGVGGQRFICMNRHLAECAKCLDNVLAQPVAHFASIPLEAHMTLADRILCDLLHKDSPKKDSGLIITHLSL